MTTPIRSNPVDHCLLCGCATRVPIYTETRDLYVRVNAPERWNLVRCTSCGFVYLDPQPIPEDIGKAYENYFTHQVNSETQHPPKRQSIVRILLDRTALSPLRHQQRLINRMYLESLRPGKLLDVGCGNGRFLAEMRDLGWEVQGVEVDAQAAEAARQVFGIPVFIGDLEHASFHENSFDVVTLNHVIEHVYDPIKLLSECRRVLRPEGMLVVTTPNIRGLGLWFFGRAWAGLDAPRHLYVFSRRTLRVCIGKPDSILTNCGQRPHGPEFSSVSALDSGAICVRNEKHNGSSWAKSPIGSF